MNSKLYSFSIVFIFFFTTTIAYTDEKISITTDEQAKEILMGHDWKCDWKDPYYSGTSKVIISEASLSNIIGKGQSSTCPDGWGKFKGKIKKGKLQAKNYDYPGPCAGSNNLTSVYYKAADGSYYSKGKYRPSAYQASGDYHCKSVPKGTLETEIEG